ncbi:hypothetical protein GIB67_042812, partial [Kingdonia uniflora]
YIGVRNNFRQRQSHRIKPLQSGFGWKEDTQLVTAEEMVWKEFIETWTFLVIKDYATGIEAGTENDETNITQEGFEVDNEGVESIYSTIDEKIPNRASSSTTPTSASAPSTGALAPKKNRVRCDSLDSDDRVIEKLALAAYKLTGNVGQLNLAVLKKELKEILTLSKEDLMKALFYYRDNDGVAQGFLAMSKDSKDYFKYEIKNI